MDVIFLFSFFSFLLPRILYGWSYLSCTTFTFFFFFYYFPNIPSKVKCLRSRAVLCKEIFRSVTDDNVTTFYIALQFPIVWLAQSCASGHQDRRSFLLKILVLFCFLTIKYIFVTKEHFRNTWITISEHINFTSAPRLEFIHLSLVPACSLMFPCFARLLPPSDSLRSASHACWGLLQSCPSFFFSASLWVAVYFHLASTPTILLQFFPLHSSQMTQPS